MILLFFPSSLFAWVFSGGLLCALAAASWTDMRRMIVPKWITLTTLGLGAAANMARGTWLGWCGLPTWMLGPGWGWGLLDGLLFTLAGVGVGFVIMCRMWVLGVCGGGDVKLYAAVGLGGTVEHLAGPHFGGLLSGGRRFRRHGGPPYPG